MPLDYQFDARSLTARDTSPSLGEGGLDRDIVAPRVWGQTVFLFRDPRTSAALRKAPEMLREALEELRFGYGAHRSPCPSGFYPPRDEVVRNQLIERLDEMIADGRLDFDELHDFESDDPEAERFQLEGLVDSLMSVTPMPADGVKRPRVTPVRHRVAFRLGVGIVTGLIAAMLVGFVGPGLPPFNEVLSGLR